MGRIPAGLELAPHRVRRWLNRRDDEQFWPGRRSVRGVPAPAAGHSGHLHRRETASRPSPASIPRPPRRGLARREFEYVRNGTASIIAALHVATGQVITEPIEHNDSVTFTGFLHRLDQCTDPRLDIHLVIDNGPSHTSAATRAWIAAHPRISVTCTPKHASWLDMAELWFSILARRLLRRGEFTSPADLTDKITSFAIRYNRTAGPFTWTYDARADHARHLTHHTDHDAASVLPEAA